MDNPEYEDFLLKIADKVEELVAVPENRKCFEQYSCDLGKKHKAYSEAWKRAKAVWKTASAKSLSDRISYLKNKGWDQSEIKTETTNTGVFIDTKGHCCWKPPGIPTEPLFTFLSALAGEVPEAPIPKADIALEYYYFALATIHDKMRKGDYPPIHNDSGAKRLARSAWAIINKSVDKQHIITAALDHVKANLHEKPAKTERGKTETNFSRIDYAGIFRRLEKQFENLSHSGKPTKKDIEATTVPAGRSLYSVIRNGFLDSLSPPDWLRSETLLPNLVDEENQPKFGNWKSDEYSLYWIFAMQWLPTANITSVPDYSSLQWAKREWSEEDQKAVRVGFDNEADYIRHIQACGTMYIEACNLIASVLEGEDNSVDNVRLDKTIEQIIIELEAWENKYLPDNSKNGKIELLDIVTGKLLEKAVRWLQWNKHQSEAEELKAECTKILKWFHAGDGVLSQNLEDNPFVANEKGFSLKLTGILRDIVEMARSDSITEKPAEIGQENGIETKPSKDGNTMENYLCNITRETENIIRNDAKKTQFLKSIEAYREMREKFLQALQQSKDNAIKNTKLLYDEKDRKLPISEEEWEQGWELEDDYLIEISIEGKTVLKKFWRRPLPFNPDAWVMRYYGSPQYNDIVAIPKVPEKPKEPNNAENLVCKYIVLAVIHDKSRYKPLSQILTIDDDSEWVENLWSSIKWLKSIDGDKFEDRTSNINAAIDDLAKKPAGKGQEASDKTGETKTEERISLKDFIKKHCDLSERPDIDSKCEMLMREHRKDRIELPLVKHKYRQGQRKLYYLGKLIKNWSDYRMTLTTLPPLKKSGNK